MTTNIEVVDAVVEQIKEEDPEEVNRLIDDRQRRLRSDVLLAKLDVLLKVDGAQARLDEAAEQFSALESERPSPGE